METAPVQLKKTIDSWERWGRQKYCLSYPKPPVLDMKWENRDIDVAEQAKIPNFSKISDIGILLRLFKIILWWCISWYDDMVVGYIKLYGHREKADTSF